MPKEESEGTQASVSKWLKQPGEAVSENEPLVEINTDKVTIEIAAPASGVLSKLSVAEGDTVLPGAQLGLIQSEGEPALTERSGGLVVSDEVPVTAKQSSGGAVPDSFSPAVRRLLREHNLDPDSIPKVSRGGRLTIADVLAFLDNTQSKANAKPPGREKAFIGRRVPHTPMRKSIANHMARSVQTAPHVTSVFEADLSRVLADRESLKVSDPENVPSVTAYLIQAALKAIKVVPEVNSKWHDDALEVFDGVNFGFGTALYKGGLVVPVIRDADRMDLPTLSRTLRELTNKARSSKLTMADMEGGTFTLSNHGVSGSLLAAPIILPDGQAAILGAGKMQRRVIVCETGGRELFRIRPMMYVTLTVDHRVLDGQQTNGFLTAFVTALETPGE
jgi:2-oxoglutarate dehydrogenase E2 component (dihydrolipoamide succinyltransferase)